MNTDALTAALEKIKRLTTELDLTTRENARLRKQLDGEPLFRPNKAYRDWLVARYPCLNNCGRHATDGAHVISKGARGYDVGNMIPLCHECHMRQHTEGWESLNITAADAAAFAIMYAVAYKVNHP